MALEQRKTHFILGKYKLPVHNLQNSQINPSRNNNNLLGFDQAKSTQSTYGLQSSNFQLGKPEVNTKYWVSSYSTQNDLRTL